MSESDNCVKNTSPGLIAEVNV